MSLFDLRLDHIEHYGAKGMRWGVVKKEKVASANKAKIAATKKKKEAATRRRLALERKDAKFTIDEKTGEKIPIPTAGGSEGSETSEESETFSKEETDEEAEDEKKGEAKSPKAPIEKPKKEEEKLNKEQKVGKKLNAEAWKNRKKLAELEKELSEAKKIINDKELAERKTMVRKMLDSDISYASVGSRTAASSGVLGFVLKKETG